MADDGGEEFDDGIGDEVCVIIDNGSGVCKAGLSTSNEPTHIFPEVIGKPRKVWKQSLDKDVYFGNQCDEIRNKLAIGYPLENGIIENFEQMELLWEYTFFEQLKVDPGKHPVLLTEPPYNPKPNREKVVEIMFEAFGVPCLNISIQGVLALLSQGKTTGLVLDCGEGVTSAIPVVDGFGMPHCVQRLDLAGRNLNTCLAKLLAQEGTSLTTTTEQHHVRMMKEQHCYVSMDPDEENAEKVLYQIPGGRKVELDDVRYRCAEALFNPSMMGLEAEGVAGLVWESIQKSELDVRKSLLGNVLLSGGSTMFPGFAKRLKKELMNYAPVAAHAGINIIDTKDSMNAVWKGGQMFTKYANVNRGVVVDNDYWMTIDDYDEYGASFIHDKLALKYS